MNAYEILSLVLSVIALVGVFATAINVSYKLGQHNQRLIGHDLEIKELKVKKVDVSVWDMLMNNIADIKEDLKKLTDRGCRSSRKEE